MNLMNNEKHYNTLNNYYQFKYQKKDFKVSLNGGFSCPNKDGKKGFGGCTYCSELGSGDFAGDINKSLPEQFFEIKKMMEQKWPDALYIPYFQANSNTYADIKTLKEKYESVIHLDEKIVMLSISTRPDCLDDDIIAYLGELNTKIPVQIELGFQTSNEKTIQAINRNCTNQEFERAIKLLRKQNIEVVVHIINGLPNETKDDMLNTIKYLNQFDYQGIKIHLLHIMKNTKMGEDYLKNPFKTLTLNEYVDIVTEQIRILKPNIIIHRLTGDAPRDLLIEPLWSLKKFVVMNEIDKEMRKKNAYQGDHYNGQSS